MRCSILIVPILASLLLCGCEPPANQAQSAPASSPPAPPTPPGTVPPSPPGPAPGAGEAPSPAPAPLGLSPLAAYYNVDDRINAVLMKVTDGPSANAAADELTPLIAEIKLTLRPYLASLAAMTDEQRNAFLQEKQAEAIRREKAGEVLRHDKLIELAREPGNEKFKAALVSMFQTLNAEGSTGIKRSATRMLERLNRP
jgi:hypothetical protein